MDSIRSGAMTGMGSLGKPIQALQDFKLNVSNIDVGK